MAVTSGLSLSASTQKVRLRSSSVCTPKTVRTTSPPPLVDKQHHMFPAIGLKRALSRVRAGTVEHRKYILSHGHVIGKASSSAAAATSSVLKKVVVEAWLAAMRSTRKQARIEVAKAVPLLEELPERGMMLARVFLPCGSLSFEVLSLRLHAIKTTPLAAMHMKRILRGNEMQRRLGRCSAQPLS